MDFYYLVISGRSSACKRLMKNISIRGFLYNSDNMVCVYSVVHVCMYVCMSVCMYVSVFSSLTQVM